MNFKNFCQPFYSEEKHLHGLKTELAKYQIAYFFLRKSVREEIEPTIIFVEHDETFTQKVATKIKKLEKSN